MRRSREPIRVTEDNTVIEGEHFEQTDHGVYVTKGVQGTIIRNCTFKGVWGPAIYLDAESTDTLVENNRFIGNGYYHWKRPQMTRFTERWTWNKRESIAIDGAWSNTIRQNSFRESALCAISLYTNCGEYGQEPRKPGADHNDISDNMFTDGHIGIWLAARAYRDMTTWECTRGGERKWIWEVPKQPYPLWWSQDRLISWIDKRNSKYSPVTLRITQVPDYASHNTGTGNSFFNVKHPIIDNGHKNVFEKPPFFDDGVKGH